MIKRYDEYGAIPYIRNMEPGNMISEWAEKATYTEADLQEV